MLQTATLLWERRLEARMGSSCSSLLKRGASVSEPEGDFLGVYGAVLMSASAER